MTSPPLPAAVQLTFGLRVGPRPPGSPRLAWLLVGTGLARGRRTLAD